MFSGGWPEHYAKLLREPLLFMAQAVSLTETEKLQLQSDMN